MNNEYYTDIVHIVSETDSAYKFLHRNGKEYWIPRSLLRRVVKFQRQPGKLREASIELEAWKAEELGWI